MVEILRWPQVRKMSDLGVSLTFIICGSVQFNRTWRQCDEFASFLGVTSRSDSRYTGESEFSKSMFNNSAS